MTMRPLWVPAQAQVEWAGSVTSQEGGHTPLSCPLWLVGLDFPAGLLDFVFEPLEC